MDEIILIRWIDSATTHGWQCIDDVCSIPTYCESVGYLVSENEESIIIAQTKGIKTHTPYAEYINIPKVSIKDRFFVKIIGQNIPPKKDK